MQTIAVVTGAASGIGAATAERLQAGGQTVLGVDLHAADTALGVVGDVADPQTWTGVGACLERVAQPVTTLVAAAGLVLGGSVLSAPLEEFRRVVEVNLFGSVLALRACLPAMVDGGGGAVVTVASVDALYAERETAAYAAAKGALLQLTRSVALDFAGDGVRANCVCPGVTDTPFFRAGLPAEPAQRAAHIRRRADRNPVGRLLDPDEIAAAICFLAGPDAAGITGSCVVVDGGLTAGFEFPRTALTAPRAD
jgi:NAD(P)-dependent dehydrogenase (short-subunit alcohol dehydrogenase family)